MKLIYINFSTTHTDAEAIMIHNITPCRSGFTPTVFKVSLDKAAPIKNSVMVKPILAASTIVPEKFQQQDEYMCEALMQGQKEK